ASATQRDVVRLGAIGVDSSHLPEFTRRIAALHDAGTTKCKVTSYWAAPQADMPAEDVAKWVTDTQAMGVTAADSLDAMLDEVDGVMVLAVSGSKHRELALPALKRGLPTYIDKPLANTLDDARAIAAAAADHDAPCYSASSLRFVAEIDALDRQALGDVVAVDAYGPGELHELMPGVLFYGVHSIELVDAIWGPGVKRVAAEHFADRDLLKLEYADGRHASIRLDRKGSYAFGATVHGSKSVAPFVVDFATVYDRLVSAMVRFFEGQAPPVTLDRIVENVAVMVAANASIERGNAWVELDG
ncbi:MAG: Gfo/Idh/MocA family oxidoreductase, partial [Planctomycetota bacterium]